VRTGAGRPARRRRPSAHDRRSRRAPRRQQGLAAPPRRAPLRRQAVRWGGPLFQQALGPLYRTPGCPLRLVSDVSPLVDCPYKEDRMTRPRPRRPAPSGGSVYPPARRLPRQTLPTRWISHYVDGKKRRESARTTDLETAQRLLRTRLHALDEGTYIGPERERLTVDAVLDALLDSYVAKGRASADTAPSQVKAWRAPLG